MSLIIYLLFSYKHLRFGIFRENKFRYPGLCFPNRLVEFGWEIPLNRQSLEHKTMEFKTKSLLIKAKV
jgi:hypothetical protein